MEENNRTQQPTFAKKPTRTIFLSCVSSQFAVHRSNLKQEFANAGLELSIQEDFADAASAHGTLLKLYRFLQKADMVVQLIGSHPGDPVRYPMVEELLRVDRTFKLWPTKKRIFEDVQAGRLTYTDFESYLAIYVGLPFVPIRFGGSIRTQHEDRLHRLGRHVNAEASQLDQVLGIVQKAIDNAPEVQKSGVSMVLLGSIRSTVALFVFLLASCGIMLLFQLASTWHPPTAPNFRDWLTILGLWQLSILVPIALYLALMWEELSFSFRLETSLRNSVAVMLLASSVGTAFAALDGLFDWMWLSWWNLISVSIVCTALHHWSIRLQGQNQATSKIIFSFVLATAQWIALIWLFQKFGWRTDVLYWVCMLAGIGVLCYAAQDDTASLRKWFAYDSSDLTPGTRQWEDAYYWVRKDEVLAQIQLDDFRAILPRPRNSKGSD